MKGVIETCHRLRKLYVRMHVDLDKNAESPSEKSEREKKNSLPPAAVKFVILAWLRSS